MVDGTESPLKSNGARVKRGAISRRPVEDPARTTYPLRAWMVLDVACLRPEQCVWPRTGMRAWAGVLCERLPWSSGGVSLFKPVWLRLSLQGWTACYASGRSVEEWIIDDLHLYLKTCCIELNWYCTDDVKKNSNSLCLFARWLMVFWICSVHARLILRLMALKTFIQDQHDIFINNYYSPGILQWELLSWNGVLWRIKRN